MAVALALACTGLTAAGAQAVTPPATPRADCGPGSHPAPGLQGRVSAAEVNSGAADNGYTCNTSVIGHQGASGGFKVLRFVDRAGHECAYYDTALLFPLNAQNLGDQPTGVSVLDMTHPSTPTRTTSLETPAMQSPHESLNLSQKRGLLVAVLGNPGTAPGQVDVYDVNKDCRHPVLDSSLPVGFLGHESGFAPDGRTFYATSLFSGDVTAVDLTNPKLPVPLKTFSSPSHGLSISDDGNRGYVAARGVGLTILDLSDIQWRRPNPQVRTISNLGWDTLTVPQIAIPVTIKGHPYAVEIDEFSTDKKGGPFPAMDGPFVGAARIIDIQNEKAPKVISDIRLEVNQPQNRAAIAGDPGAKSYVQGYAGHYCNVPQRKDPGILACTFIASGLRMFDIRDPYHPKEIAYFVAPPKPSPGLMERSNYAMSSPSFVPERREVWYSDGNSGFYALRVTNNAWPTGAGGVVPPSPGCLRQSKVVFHLHRVPHTRIVRVEAYVNGRRKLARTGHDIRRVVLKGLPRKGRLHVKVVATHSTGAKVVSTRGWKGCRKGKPHVYTIPRPS